MNKTDFLRQYRSARNPKIRVYFDDHLFLDKKFELSEGVMPLGKLLHCYIPKYSKNERLDSRRIEDIMLDPASRIIRLSEAISAPEDWDVSANQADLTSLNNLWPIPIATDTKLHKTLLLDGCHTLCKLLSNTTPNDPETLVSYVEIRGAAMKNIIADFFKLEQTGSV